MLFQYGRFRAASGRDLDWKIECDALMVDDWEAIAKIAGPLLQPFQDVFGVPRGGLRLAYELRPYITYDGPPLVVDDVWTSGKSMTKYVEGYSFRQWKGFVVFARGDTPEHVKYLFKQGMGE